MTDITLKGNPIHTSGKLPDVGSSVKDFTLVKGDLSEVKLSEFEGKKKLLNIFPSLDTSTCSASVRAFAKHSADVPNSVVLNISKDLPFAQSRFCSVEHINGVETLSAFRATFAKDYGLEIVDGPLSGLCSRAVIILDSHNRVVYCEQVPEITQEPDYDKALDALKKAT